MLLVVLILECLLQRCELVLEVLVLPSDVPHLVADALVLRLRLIEGGGLLIQFDLRVRDRFDALVQFGFRILEALLLRFQVGAPLGHLFLFPGDGILGERLGDLDLLDLGFDLGVFRTHLGLDLLLLLRDGLVVLGDLRVELVLLFVEPLDLLLDLDDGFLGVLQLLLLVHVLPAHVLCVGHVEAGLQVDVLLGGLHVLLELRQLRLELTQDDLDHRQVLLCLGLLGLCLGDVGIVTGDACDAVYDAPPVDVTHLGDVGDISLLHHVVTVSADPGPGQE